MGNIRKKHYPLRPTYEEAEHFHYAFFRYAGPEWAELITREMLVTWPLYKIIDHGKSEGLIWPETLPALFRFRSVLDAHAGNSGLAVSYKREGTKGVVETGSNYEVEPHETLRRYTPGEKFLLGLDNVSETHREVMIFYVADKEFEDTQTEDPTYFDMVLLRRDVVAPGEVMLRSPDDKSYTIVKARGRFCLYAIALSSESGTPRSIGSNLAEGQKLTWQESDALLAELKQLLTDSPDAIQIASHPYEV